MSDHPPPKPPEREPQAPPPARGANLVPVSASPFAVPEGRRIQESDYDPWVDASPLRLSEYGTADEQ
jgi:hypothetical protein